jgi:hypothetical protein
MRHAFVALGAVLMAAKIWAGAQTPPSATLPATHAATAAVLMNDEELKAAAEKIKAQKWASKRDVYAELIKLVRPGQTVAQLKLVLPVGMGIEQLQTAKATVSGTNPTVITLDPWQVYAGSTLFVTGSSWSVSYTLDAENGVSCSGAWTDSGGKQDEAPLIIRNGPTLAQKEPATTTSKAAPNGPSQ